MQDNRLLDKLIHKLVKVAPKIARVPIALVPFHLYQTPLQAALRHVFRSQLEEGELDFLEDRWLEVYVADLGWKFCISVEDEQLMLQAPGPETDVQFRANSDDLLLIAARQQDPDTLFFQRRLMINGDTELGLAIKNLMDAVEWDQLPRALSWALQSAAGLVGRAQAYQQSAA